MSEYTIGKDISILEQRIENLERVCYKLQKSINELTGVKEEDNKEE